MVGKPVRAPAMHSVIGETKTQGKSPTRVWDPRGLHGVDAT